MTNNIELFKAYVPILDGGVQGGQQNRHAGR